LQLRSFLEGKAETLSRWEGLIRFLDDGRIEIGPNVVERSIRPIAADSFGELGLLCVWISGSIGRIREGSTGRY
jgi:hypothetical protein